MTFRSTGFMLQRRHSRSSPHDQLEFLCLRARSYAVCVCARPPMHSIHQNPPLHQAQPPPPPPPLLLFQRESARSRTSSSSSSKSVPKSRRKLACCLSERHLLLKADLEHKAAAALNAADCWCSRASDDPKCDFRLAVTFESATILLLIIIIIMSSSTFA